MGRGRHCEKHGDMTGGHYGILFEPVKIGPVKAPNRFYAVPHATGHGWNQPNGAIALRAMKAEGGWGTVAMQISEIAPDSDIVNHPMERIWDENDIPRHAAQVDAIKAFRASHKAAALRAKQAGYDIIYVYAAHDLSILSHSLSLRTNQRNDECGGTFENRVRLLREVLEDTLKVTVGERAVALRFSVAEPGRPGGLSHDGEGRDVVEALAETPDLWDVNLSGWSDDSATARFADEGFQLPYTDFVKSLTTKPVVGVGRFTSPDMMVSLVKKGRLDLIGAAQPSIAGPFLPDKIRH